MGSGSTGSPRAVEPISLRFWRALQRQGRVLGAAWLWTSGLLLDWSRHMRLGTQQTPL